MSSQVYPASSSIRIINPITVKLQYKTLKGEKFGLYQKEQRKSKRSFPLRLLTLKYEGLTPSEMRELFQFYQDMLGAYDDFSFFFPTTWTPLDYENEYVGVGDGSSTLFNMPCVSGEDVVIYNNGIELTDEVDYYYYQEGGTTGEDYIEFDSGSIPENGDVITADFTGHLKVRCSFLDDELSAEQFSELLVNTGVDLQGQMNE